MPSPDSFRAGHVADLQRHPSAFSDQHCHGFAGVDFAHASSETVATAVALLRQRGTQYVTASLPTMAPEQLLGAVQRLAPSVHDGTLAGIHLEGPFLAHAKCGAHPAQHLQIFSNPECQDWLNQLLDSASGTVKTMTYAPELPGSQELEKVLARSGVTPSPGHTDASYEVMSATIKRVVKLTGYPVLITHAFNAMASFHHRAPGPMLAIVEGCARGEVLIELICDGHHVAPELIRYLFEHVPHSIRVVSDASSATFSALVSDASHSTQQNRLTLGDALLTRCSITGVPKVAGTQTLASGATDVAGAYDNLVAWGIDPKLARAGCTR